MVEREQWCLHQLPSVSSFAALTPQRYKKYFQKNAFGEDINTIPTLKCAFCQDVLAWVTHRSITHRSRPLVFKHSDTVFCEGIRCFPCASPTWCRILRFQDCIFLIIRSIGYLLFHYELECYRLKFQSGISKNSNTTCIKQHTTYNIQHFAFFIIH